MARDFKTRNKRRGFTLVELLVVIAIVGLISTVAVMQMSTSKNKARITAGQSFDASINRLIGDRLIGEWLFDDTSTTTAFDSSGLGKTGSISGAVHVTGYNSKSALSFNGTTNYIDIPYGWPATGQSFALTAWVYDTGSGSNEIIFDASNGRVSMEIQNSNLACLTNNDAWKAGSTNTLPKNTWVHVACVFDASAGTITGYMNAVVAFSVADNAPAADPTQIRINGNVNGAYRLTGYIDDVRLYASSLTASTIKKDFAEKEEFYKKLTAAR